MYEVYPNLQQPDDDAMLWRYVSLANFVALLVERYLFFSRLDCLEDPFEGAPSYNVVSIMQRIGRMPQSAHAKAEKYLGHWREAMKVCRRRICVNCWHMSEHGSEAMWKLYGRLGENVAIVSNLRSLRDSFSQSPLVTGALVEYRDEPIDEIRLTTDQPNSMYAWASRKRPSYEHEREFRLIHLQDDDPTSTARGTHFAVDPSKFVEEIVLSPLMPWWQVLTLHNLIYRLDYDLRVRESGFIKSAFLG